MNPLGEKFGLWKWGVLAAGLNVARFAAESLNRVFPSGLDFSTSSILWTLGVGIVVVITIAMCCQVFRGSGEDSPIPEPARESPTLSPLYDRDQDSGYH